MRRTVILALSALGFALSLGLEALHARAYLKPSASSFCAVGEHFDCQTVALSRYSVIAGVPVALIGALGFLAIALAAWRRSRWLVVLTAGAALASLALLGLELFSIGAVCFLCEAVHAVCFALAVLAFQERKALAGALGDREDLARIVATPLLGFVALALFLPRYWAVFGWKGDVPFRTGTTEEGHPWIGAEEPNLVVEEFVDYHCPHCRAASARSLRRLARHQSSLRIVRRQYPRSRCTKRPSPVCLAVRMAYCAEEQGKFWQADRWLFAHGAPGGLDAGVLAKDLGLNLKTFESCLVRPDINERALSEAGFAMEQKFPGTPAFVVEGKRVDEEHLDEMVSDLP